MVKISVIMPVYNAEKYLEESLDSVLNQTLEDIEVICIDDGSKDNSLKILRNYEKKDSRVFVYHQENKGDGAARNFGLSKIKGKYLYFMDSDDFLDLNAFHEFYDIAEEKNVDFVICKSINYDSDKNKLYETEYFSMNKLYNFVEDEVFNFADIGELIFHISVTPWGKLFNTEFVLNSGAKFLENISFSDNIFFWEVMFNSSQIFFYNKILCYRRVHSESIMESNGDYLTHTLKINNLIANIFIKYGYFDKFKRRLYYKKLYNANERYKQIKDKEFFFDEMKKDFSKMINNKNYNDFIKLIPVQQKIFFENVLKADTYKEFDLLMENFKLSQDNVKLSKKIDKLNSQNVELVSSNSWKITKPLRRVGSFKKYLIKIIRG